jgi:hypothetical protein
MAKLASQHSLSDVQRAKITPMDSDKKIKAVLTDDQKKKYEEFEQEMCEQMKERR